jgi:hypothetical protein
MAGEKKGSYEIAALRGNNRDRANASVTAIWALSPGDRLIETIVAARILTCSFGASFSGLTCLVFYELAPCSVPDFSISLREHLLCGLAILGARVTLLLLERKLYHPPPPHADTTTISLAPRLTELADNSLLTLRVSFAIS